MGVPGDIRHARFIDINRLPPGSCPLPGITPRTMVVRGVATCYNSTFPGDCSGGCRVDKKLISSLAWIGTAVVIVITLGPVWLHWSDTLVIGFGGADACLQMGLLEWSAAHWQDPGIWPDLPIFYPLAGSIGYMDSLLGQALYRMVQGKLHENDKKLLFRTF